MIGYEFCGGYWWIFPLLMMVCCFFFMRRGCSRWMCGWDGNVPGGSALDILNRRYAKGDIDQTEYEEKKRKIAETNRSD